MFIENLEKEILPFLANLMEHLLSVLKTTTSMRSKGLAISAIGAVAVAAKGGLVPYFPQIMEHFQSYLHTKDESEDMKKLQIQTIETLGVLARNIGEATFLPLCKECLEFGLTLLESTDDPDVQRCVYTLIGAVSNLMKSDMSEYMNKIVNYMLLSAKSLQGVTHHYKEETEQIAIFNDDDEDEVDIDDEGEDEEDIQGISVENSYLDVKENACTALGELAVNCGQAFFPYLEECYAQVLHLVDYLAPGVKKGAVSALSQFCLCVYQVHFETQSEETKTALLAMIPTVVQKYMEVIKTEIDRTVVMVAIDSLFDMLDKIGSLVVHEAGIVETILVMIKEVFTHKLTCQDGEDEDEDSQAEYDGMLIESAGDILPIMARLIGGEQFLPFFSSFIVDLLKRLKETSSTAEKSFAVGTLAETIDACGQASVMFVDTLYPVFVRMIKEEDDEVRSNAVYALGVLAMYGGDKMQTQYKEILKLLFEVLNKETNNLVMDNIAAASCRLIMTNKDKVPLEHVIPIIMRCLPLKEDKEEWKTVLSCLFLLYSQRCPQVVNVTHQLLTIVASLTVLDDVKEEVQQMIGHFVQDISIAYPAVLASVQASLEPHISQKLALMLNCSPT